MEGRAAAVGHRLTLEDGTDVEGGLEAALDRFQVGQPREIPVERKTQQIDLEAESVRRDPVDQPMFARIPELEVLILERRAADVEKDASTDSLEAADGEGEQVDQRKTVLDVGVADRVSDLRRVVEPAQRVETAEVIDVGKISGRVRAVEADREERTLKDLDVEAQIRVDAGGQRVAVGAGSLAGIEIRSVIASDPHAAPGQGSEIFVVGGVADPGEIDRRVVVG